MEDNFNLSWHEVYEHFPDTRDTEEGQVWNMKMTLYGSYQVCGAFWENDEKKKILRLR